jgi:hypothetical protein
MYESPKIEIFKFNSSTREGWSIEISTSTEASGVLAWFLVGAKKCRQKGCRRERYRGLPGGSRRGRRDKRKKRSVK